MWNYRLHLIAFTILLAYSHAEDYYKLLGVERNANEREIRRAFKKIAITEHPDKKNDDPKAHERFIKFTTAYEVLKDPDLRKKYDLYGEEGLNNQKRQQSYRSYTYYQNNFGIYDDDPEIITLSKNDYFDSVLDSEKMWFINFYSPMCSHCHYLAPIWRKVAKDLEGVIRIGAVNCEDDWHICNQVGIQSYPTLLYYPKKSKRGVKYAAAKTHQAITEFVYQHLDTNVKEISSSSLDLLINKKTEAVIKPTLIFISRKNRDYLNLEEKLKIAAIFDQIVDVKVFKYKKNVFKSISEETSAIYISPESNLEYIEFENDEEVKDIVKKILKELPEPKDIDEFEFEDIMSELRLKSDGGWLLCFYMGHATEFDILLKQLPSLLKYVNLAKINCGRYPTLCKQFNINHYPAWGVAKPGGAFELNYGKNTMNDIANFAKASLKAQNVWSLSEDKIHSILKRQTGEAWFLDWYTPWCPPCLKFIPEVRKASLEFDNSQIRFGMIDCTVHAELCKSYNIRYYPTGMLVNGSKLLQFQMQKTATSVIQFINEAMDPSVISLGQDNFKTLEKKKLKELWVVDFFAPWCGPCQALAPEWTKVAKALKTLPFVKIASVDCETEKHVCQSQGVQSYPTIRLYPANSEGLNSVGMYSGERDSTSMLRWISNFFPVSITDLTSQNFQTKVLNTDEKVLVDFFAPWCGHCIALEPEYAIAAQSFKNKVKFMKINCDRYHEECNEANIRAYPTIFLYESPKSTRSINNAIPIRANSAEEIIKEVNQIIGKTRRKREEL